jgi:hypothetical protein
MTGNDSDTQTFYGNLLYTENGFIVQQTLPSRIHRLGRVCLRHLGEMPDRAEGLLLYSPLSKLGKHANLFDNSVFDFRH